ncbi:SDR family oxidoreductase [Rhizobium sp. VS19-DR104.2]|uniref:SDR family NAD(P)-dependent oxidoreductase n=1 Tax=unclassified Rhizobium TaxID=2613769 RepID=UPI001C5AAD13|nr:MULTISPECIES: SDR family oxidoreductase [unclassified Rhizobium]MBZ5760529.1 SDR family oxidoreductase [Rhizobium sp. VS19-DR96]MBZ5766627.1 SDR family oxidoreductase [Rhizobium sp. VS19-DR129.2]MBZ5773380.1 SDR family oxidoreductase [Rhizobium sp. VS19-DRK62.2]MBZ5784364.1 SDR family oxidoreductase [Rhizobium sp. VS19-DR121]MBZ5802724.1 SDR family oxidoreductase [Rhizobium sp. VS19-DR181]
MRQEDILKTPSAQIADLKDKAVLITGGGSGIGAALVEGFAMQGARVAFIDIAETASRALAARISNSSAHPVSYYHADLRDVSSIKSTVAAIESDFDAIRVLVNNAGWDGRHQFDTASEADWDDSQAINLKQMFFVSQAVAPLMRAGGGGAIVNFSSIAFMLNMPDVPIYATAKAGIIGLTKSMAGRLGPEDIRVNAILPGMIVTERQKELWLTDESIARMVDRQCLKHVLTAEDLVGPCLFLASDLAAGITAQSIIVDGGVF